MVYTMQTPTVVVRSPAGVALWRILLLVILVAAIASAVGAQWAGKPATARHLPATTVPYPTPPGWTAHPGDPTDGQVCFNALCYHVDGQGTPYGPPIGWNSQNN